jgi:hypothetical protein
VTLQAYVVYPKRGEPITVDFRRFEIIDNKLHLYDRYDSVAEDRLIVLENVAALVPVNQRRTDGRFRVTLRHSRSFEICADSFKIDEPQVLRFFCRQYDQQKEIKEVYVAVAELVAIFPIRYDGW